MRKFLLAFGVILLTLLAACGSDTADEVYTKAIEASEKMESAELTMDIEQNIEVPSEEATINQKINMDAEMTLDPLAMYQKGTISMEMDEFPLDVESEMYMVEDEIFMYDSMTSQWMKMDNSMMPTDMLQNAPSTKDQLEMMEEYVEDFELEENDDYYVLKLTADGEGFTELTNQLMEDNFGEQFSQLGVDVTEILENMKVNNLYIEMNIDKETYDVKEQKMDMEMEITAEGESLTIVQKSTTKYTGINTVDAIEIPQEVKDGAVEGPGF